MSYQNFKVIEDGDMSQATVESAPINLAAVKSLSFQAEYSGAPVGDIEIQVSNDVVSSPDDISNWDTVAGSQLHISAAGIYSRDTGLISYAWARIVYTKVSGTGVLNANVNLKAGV